MTQLQGSPTTMVEPMERDWSAVRGIIYKSIDALDEELRALNRKIHESPELCYEEFKAHDNITAFLRTQGIEVVPHAYGIATSFKAEYGSGGRLITFCAEYDALRGLGHACGHNLIATSSTASFLGVVAALRYYQIPGRVRLLGTPAEEGGGGKIKLINAGAFSEVDAAMMIHPIPSMPGADGVAYGNCLAVTNFKVHFMGKAAHAGVMPWQGINAMDAASLAYMAIGLLRQQCRPTDRLNITFKQDEETTCNIISPQSIVDLGIRCTSAVELDILRERVVKCMEGAALATGCAVEVRDEMVPYAELRPNETICDTFTKAMQHLGSQFICDLLNKAQAGYGTDMGNVSYICPSFHGTFGIPVRSGETLHGPGFSRAANTPEAHQKAIQGAKGMAFTGWTILADDLMATQMRRDFEIDVQSRQ